jgi:hypothetical protein
MGTGPPPGAGAPSDPLRARPLVAGVPGKHHAVDHERVHAGCEQLGQAHVNGVAVDPSPLEGAVAGHHSAGRQPSPRDSHRLPGAAQLDLPLEQPTPRRPVLSWLSWKPDTHEVLPR